jgi:hypothetical protein
MTRIGWLVRNNPTQAKRREGLNGPRIFLGVGSWVIFSLYLPQASRDVVHPSLNLRRQVILLLMTQESGRSDRLLRLSFPVGPISLAPLPGLAKAQDRRALCWEQSGQLLCRCERQRTFRNSKEFRARDWSQSRNASSSR